MNEVTHDKEASINVVTAGNDREVRVRLKSSKSTYNVTDFVGVRLQPGHDFMVFTTRSKFPLLMYLFSTATAWRMIQSTAIRKVLLFVYD